jgi:DNA-binding NarL/FixJ family response regulator
MMSDIPIKVMIIAEDPLARAGLAALLENERGISIAGSMASDAVSNDMLALYLPDVILWDVGWESGSQEPQETSAEIDWSDALMEDGPPLVALISDESQAVFAWTSGAQGLLDRGSPGSEVMIALQAVTHGLTVMKQEFGVQLMPTIEGSEISPLEPLTAREFEVLQLLAEGISNKELAQRLEVSEHTVKFHVNSIFRKLGAQSRTQAVVRASRLGLILL